MESSTSRASGGPRRSSAFRWFFAGRSISLAGSFMSQLALAFGVLEITDSAGWLSAVTAAALVPMVATMLLGGGIADRYRRDTVLRLTSLGAGLTQSGVAVVLLTHQHPVLLLALSAVNGILQGLTTPHCGASSRISVPDAVSNRPAPCLPPPETPPGSSARPLPVC